MEEIWKDITNYEGKYQVSNLGRIKSLSKRINSITGGRTTKERILKPNTHKGKTYSTIEIGKGNWFLIHRIVASAFILNPDNKPFVNHIDGNKNNNRADNLEWVTQSENMIHAYRTGLEVATHAQRPHQYKRIIAIHTDGTVLTFESIKACCEALKIRYSCISRVMRGKRKHCHNFTFKFAA